MTREEAKKKAEVMMAYADGKEIEYYNTTNEIWEKHSNPFFNWGTSEYRIKPEPEYRPFKSKEECWNEMLKHQPFMWVVSVLAFMSIDEINCEGVRFTNSSSLWYYERAFKELKFVDGAPFGIKEESI